MIVYSTFFFIISTFNAGVQRIKKNLKIFEEYCEKIADLKKSIVVVINAFECEATLAYMEKNGKKARKKI